MISSPRYQSRDGRRIGEFLGILLPFSISKRSSSSLFFHLQSSFSGSFLSSFRMRRVSPDAGPPRRSLFIEAYGLGTLGGKLHVKITGLLMEGESSKSDFPGVTTFFPSRECLVY